jgi:1,4-dihydroxy-2-naphthoyl-CoA hydrolase
MIWKVKPSQDWMKSFPKKNMSDHLGIEITEVGDDYITARMPVDERTVQPYGLLHGGASCVLAETLGSIAGTFCIDISKQMVVGIEINANHIRSAKSGYVYGTVKPIHVGLSTQVWGIEIVNEEKKLVCISRLTCAVKNIG